MATRKKHDFKSVISGYCFAYFRQPNSFEAAVMLVFLPRLVVH